MDMEIVKDQVIETAEESELRNKSITYLFWKYSLFAAAGLALQVIQTFCDGTFIGNGIGPAGFAVTTITGSFWLLGMGLFGLFGIGGSTLAAIKLGGGDTDGARQVYGNVVIFCFLFTVLVSIVVYLLRKPLLLFCGATPDIMDGCVTYLNLYLIGLPFAVVSTVAYYCTRVAEKPMAASIAYIVPAILGIAFEWYAIFKMHMGIGASALAMIWGTGLAVLLVPYLHYSNSPFKLRVSDFKPDLRIIWETCRIGFAMFIIPFSTTAATIATNNALINSGGTSEHLAAFGVIQYIGFLLYMITLVFITGMQPIVSYNLGAKLYGRIREVIRVGVIQSSIMVIIILAVMYYFAEPIIIFISPDPTLLQITKAGMLIYMALYAFGNISQIVSGYFMSVEKSILAIVNGVARMTVFAVPLIFILPHYFGLNGVWMAQPAADTLACILAIICLVVEYKKLGNMA